jgi:hypothetical protein
LASVLDVVVDELLGRLVDERGEEDDRGADQGEAPEWDDLDQVVGEESANEGGTRGKEILSKDNALRLNDEKVDELGDITHE